jgi:Fe-S-cluster containining protein
METKIEKIVQRFVQLQNEADISCDELHRLHHHHTVCRKGCDQCCMNFNLLPVEFYSILNSIKGKKIEIQLTGNDEDCPFLVNHSCQIYEFRPLICRSHGLPILTMDEEGEDWELSFCPLNFTKADDNYFTNENCYQQDVFNSKLYLLNQDFISSYKEEKFESNDMLDLLTLATRL